MSMTIVLSACCYSPVSSQTQVLSNVNHFEQLLGKRDIQAREVSAWSVFQQIEHVILVNRSIAQLIIAGEPPEEIKPKTFIGYIVLATGYIPRGQGTTPQSFVPENRPNNELKQLLVETKDRVSSFDLDEIARSKVVVGNHPVFGGLTAKEWLRLMAVHDRHHLKIIGEIIKRYDS